MSGTDESAWMSAVAAGNSAAFARVVAAHEAKVITYCLRFLGDTALARDIAQEVFLTLWRERTRYREEGKLRLYLLRIARLRCLAAAKKRRSQRRLEENYSQVHAVQAESTPQAPPFAAALRSGLARLRPEHSDLLVLRYLEGLDLDEIHTVTGLRLGTIKSRLSRGLGALRKEIDHGD